MRVLFAITFLAVIICTKVDAQNHKYWLELKDKLENPYRIDRPKEFLSERAIERRLKQGIPVDIQDLPVSPFYLSKVIVQGAEVLYKSKWFNALAISCDEETKFRLEQLPFVKSIRLISFSKEVPKIVSKSGVEEFESNHPLAYGFADEQLKLLNGQFLHEQGFRGADKIIAVIDAGFIGLDNVFFDSLRTNGLMLDTKDFVDGDCWVDHSSTHGAKVLSVMAANQPGILVGTAIDASYVCIRTEDQKEEMRIEECNWVAAAEYSDSLGVDVINTSLGYARFNLAWMDYNYSDMDGVTSIVTIAADIAFSKGMLVVTSAGNNGGAVDGYINAPGDAKNILTVGATDLNGNPAFFSSIGPTADGRTKPEIVAPGKDITVAAAFGNRAHLASGTSYASPIVAGLATALWSAFPERTNMEIRTAIIQSASLYKNENNKTGAGLPDFQKAYEILKGY